MNPNLSPILTSAQIHPEVNFVHERASDVRSKDICHRWINPLWRVYRFIGVIIYLYYPGSWLVDYNNERQ